MILSQIVRGAAESLAQSDDLARALRSASDAAYRAVRKPVEGTMLTAIRELAEEAERAPRCAEIVAARRRLRRADTRAAAVLREAGVVDAGAAGLVEIVRGIAAVVTGEPQPERRRKRNRSGSRRSTRSCRASATARSSSSKVNGSTLPSLEAELEPIGDSLLVVGDRNALKVHVHTDDPGRALSLGVARGAIAGVEIANMHEQTLQREERLLHAVPADQPTAGVIAVVSGAGNRRLFESLGAVVVDGGGR